MNQFTLACRPLWLLVLALTALRAHALSVYELGSLSGVVFEPGTSQSLLVATHYGLYRMQPDGTALPVGQRRDDFVALASDPSDPRVIYALGYPTADGQSELMRSDDGGSTWSVRAGPAGQAEEDALAVSPADPGRLYAVHGALQASGDGGQMWSRIGPAPDKLITLAVGLPRPGQLFAATDTGLLVSRNGGHDWEAASSFRDTASLVYVTADGSVYAFFLGHGLMRSGPADPGWKLLYNGFGGHYPLRLAVDPNDPRHLVTLTHASGLFTSDDGGKSWRRFPKPPIRGGSVAAAGEQLYGRYCVACHGVDGVGETPGTATAPADWSRLAPALDFSAHAWHHEDGQLIEMILDGGVARGGRMPAWKTVLSRDDARDLIAYMKSLWRPRELACQGAKHMSCDWVPPIHP